MKIPSEKQLESTFEVLAWLWNRVDDKWSEESLQVLDVEELLKREVDRCLSE